MYVMKFGAVSVSDATRLRDIVNLCKLRPYGTSVVICTALAGLTDSLIQAARSATTGDMAAVEAARRDLWGRHRALAERVLHDEWEREELYREWATLLKGYDRLTRSIATLGERSPRGVDAVAALGERFITHLVALVLRQGGVAAQVVDAAELIVTNDQHGAARPLPTESIERTRKRLQPLLQAGMVPVITGYIGASREGVVTTLGRNGGDYTAALIGAAMEAAEVWIWTDVDGILTADPKIVREAHTLPELSYREASEIATFGVEVLHPRTLVPIIEHGGVLRIRNALRPQHPGTQIVPGPQPTTSAARTIISAHDLCLLTLLALDDEQWSPLLVAQALSHLSAAGVELLSFTQSFSERSMTLVVRANDAAFARDTIVNSFQRQGAVRLQEPTITAPVALVTVISARPSGSITPLVLAILGQHGIHVLALAQSATAAHLSLIVPEAEVREVVQVLHRALGLG